MENPVRSRIESLIFANAGAEFHLDVSWKGAHNTQSYSITFPKQFSFVEISHKSARVSNELSRRGIKLPAPALEVRFWSNVITISFELVGDLHNRRLTGGNSFLF